MTIATPTQSELEVVQKACEGAWADFSAAKDAQGDPAVTLDAALVRLLLLGLPLPQAFAVPGGSATLAPCGVRIRGARIDGVIDLAEAIGPDHCPPLLLHDCLLPGNPKSLDEYGRPLPALNASHARLSKLSLRNSRIAYVDITGATLLSELDLDGIAPLLDDGQCRIKATSIRVDGRITAARARLKVTQRPEIKAGETPDYALDLSDAEIKSSVLLRPGLKVNGGVRLWGVRIGGDVWLDGASLRADGNDAFNAQTACIEGNLMLCSIDKAEFRFTSVGPIWLLGASIGGDLCLNGVQLETDDPPNATMALTASAMHVKGNFTCTPVNGARGGDVWKGQIDGGIQMLGTKIGGRLALDDMEMIPKDRAMLPCLMADHVQVDGPAILQRITGAVSFSGARIRGLVDLSGAKLANYRSQMGFTAVDARFDSSLLLNGVEGACDLEGLTIAADLQVTGAVLTAGQTDRRSDKAKLFSLFAPRLKVGGDLVLISEIESEVNLSGASVDGEVVLKLDAVQNPDSGTGPQLSLEDACIGRDLKVRGFTLFASASDPWAVIRSWLDLATVLRVRDVVFYPDWEVVEALVRYGDTKAIIAFLYREGRDPVFLPGSSPSIHKHNAKGELRIDTAEQAAAYLEFFCAYVWGGAGAFTVLASTDHLKRLWESTGLEPPALDLIVIVRPTPPEQQSDGSWTTTCSVLYDMVIFEARFVIRSNGYVEMLDDRPLHELSGTKPVLYVPPMRQPPAGPSSPVLPDSTSPASGSKRPWPLPPAFGSEQEWRSKGVRELAAVHSSRTRRLLPVAAGWRVPVNLRGLSVAGLDDKNGRGWGSTADKDNWKRSVRLDMNGFVYDRLDDEGTPAGEFNDERGLTSSQPDSGKAGAANEKKRKRWEDRESWLALQYDNPRVPQPETVEQYTPQAYQHLAKVFRAEGSYDDATRIMSRKLTIERHLAEEWYQRLMRYLHHRFFDYGLSGLRASGTFIICILIGWYAVVVANGANRTWRISDGWTYTFPWPVLDEPVLAVDTAAVTDIATAETGQSTGKDAKKQPVIRLVQSSDNTVGEIPCGDQIEPLLYAIDVFIPLVDLKQETKCSVSSADRWDLIIWRGAKAMYAIVGWIVTSLALLTFSGIHRRQAAE